MMATNENIYSVLGCNTMYFRESPTFGRNISPPSLGSKRKPSKSRCEAELSFCRFLAWIDGSNYVPPKHPVLFELHSVTNQKIILFTVKTVRTSNTAAMQIAKQFLNSL
jgi:hypothetical protein